MVVYVVFHRVILNLPFNTVCIYVCVCVSTLSVRLCANYGSIVCWCLSICIFVAMCNFLLYLYLFVNFSVNVRFMPVCVMNLHQ